MIEGLIMFLCFWLACRGAVRLLRESEYLVVYLFKVIEVIVLHIRYWSTRGQLD